MNAHMQLQICSLFEFFRAAIPSTWEIELVAVREHMRLVSTNLNKTFAANRALVWSFVQM